MAYHTYFFSWLELLGDDSYAFGNEMFATESTGQLLIMDAKNLIDNEHPNAQIVSICKLD